MILLWLTPPYEGRNFVVGLQFMADGLSPGALRYALRALGLRGVEIYATREGEPAVPVELVVPAELDGLVRRIVIRPTPPPGLESELARRGACSCGSGLPQVDGHCPACWGRPA